ncbi:hypothetical protein [Brooklawnia propionicigenes]|nr:hypothetical protein [Brooklawnia sp. SH051]
MSEWPDAMEAERSLVLDECRYDQQVRCELEKMSPATIDRYSAAAPDSDLS